MSRGCPIELPFVKMEGCGNDYVYVDLTDLPADVAAWTERNAADLAREISNRNFGIGSDGLILIGASSLADAAMQMFNVDGSRGAMCGNALRCIAKHLGEGRLEDRSRITIETDSGVREARLARDGDRVIEIEVEMGQPRFGADEIPLTSDAAEVLEAGGEGPWRLAAPIGGSVAEGFALSLGNPHLVVFVDDVDQLDLAVVGPPLENAPWFPDRANIEFVDFRTTAPRQRTWERGSGETLACGSGACAVGVAAAAAGHREPGAWLDIHLRGGVLGVRWQDGIVRMRGPARRVFAGVFYPADARV